MIGLGKLRKTRVKKRLRMAGYVFLIISALVLMAAWNTGTNLFYLVFGGLASFVVLSHILAGWGLRALRVVRTAPEATHRGAEFGVSVRIENRKRLMPCVSVRVERPAAARGEQSSETRTAPATPLGCAVAIPARHAALLHVSERLERRGVHRLGPLELVSTFPFGLGEARRRFEDDVEVVVYPRVWPVRTVTLDQEQAAGDATRAVRGDGDEYFSLREYAPGDDPRHIVWRASARMGKLLVRELQVDISRSIVFALDNRRRADVNEYDYEERFEQAVELVASLAVMLLNQQFSVALVTATAVLSPGEGKAQQLAMLDMLARCPLEAESAPDPVSRLNEIEDRRGMRCFVISPDSRDWGRRNSEGTAIVDPQEVIYA